jgi:hypothetical protein
MSKVADAARWNGHFGGKPTNAMVALRRRARERATRIVAANQEEAVRFLVYVMNNPNAALSERIRCALELLNRGEMPAKSASFLGVGTSEELDAMFSSPKLVVLGKFGSDKALESGAVVVEEGKNGAPDGDAP